MTFNSREPNILHYLTFITFQRVPVFKCDEICNFLIEALEETRNDHPLKLVAPGYVPIEMDRVWFWTPEEVDKVGRVRGPTA